MNEGDSLLGRRIEATIEAVQEGRVPGPVMETARGDVVDLADGCPRCGVDWFRIRFASCSVGSAAIDANILCRNCGLELDPVGKASGVVV